MYTNTNLTRQERTQKSQTVKKNNLFSKIIIVSVLVLNILFTAVILYIFFHTGTEPTTLVGAWFLFTTGELWMLSKIKTEKIKRGEEY